MKKILLILSIALVSFPLFSQDSTIAVVVSPPSPYGFDTSAVAEHNKLLVYNYNSPSITNLFNESWRGDAKNRVTIDFDYYNNSNGAPASLAWNLLFNNEISEKLKDRVDSRLKKRLQFEDNMNTGISYRRYLPKWDAYLNLGYHHRQMRVVSGTKETYQLLFYGNARFEGDTVDLSNLTVLNAIYNQWTIGVKKMFDYGNYQMQFGINLSFLQCNNSQQIKTNNAWLYTAPDADSLIINYDLTFNMAREGATKFEELNGAGVSGDFNLAFMNKDKWKVSLDVFDVAHLFFRKNPTNYSAARHVIFKGINLPELTSFTSQTFDTLQIDSAVKANLPTRTANKYTLMLPFTAQLVFSKPLMHNKIVLSAGLQYRYLPGYKAYGFARVNYFIKPDMAFSVTAGGGSYSWFNLGVEFAKRWKYFDFTLGTGNLIGLCVPSQYPGSSIYLRLGTSF